MNREITAAVGELSERHILNYIRTNCDPKFKGVGYNFSCPNKAAHRHGDRNASAGVFRGKDNILLWKCFACGITGNIIDLYGWVKGMQGTNFIRLLEEFAREQGEELTVLDGDKFKEKKRTYRMAATASEYIIDRIKQGVGDAFLKERAITKEIAIELGVGVVDSFESYKEYMTKRFKEGELSEKGYLNPIVFDARNIIMTIKNHYQEPAGFVARNMRFEQDTSRPKYCNTKSNEIYLKGQTLYLMGDSRKYIREAKHAHVVEGYIDGITMYQAGIKNVAPLGGVAFTEAHLKELLNNEVEEITFSWDNDKVGVATAVKKIQELLSTVYNIKIRFRIVPSKQKDADKYIRDFGKAKYLALPTYDAIEYIIQITPTDDLDYFFSIVYTQIGKSVVYPHRLQGYIELISKRTNVTKEQIDTAIRSCIMSTEISEKVRKKMSALTGMLNGGKYTEALKEICYISDTHQSDIQSRNVAEIIKEYAVSNKAVLATIQYKDKDDIDRRCDVKSGSISCLSHNTKPDNDKHISIFELLYRIKSSNASLTIILFLKYEQLDELCEAYQVGDEQKKWMEDSNILLVEGYDIHKAIDIASLLYRKDAKSRTVIVTQGIDVIHINEVPVYVGIIDM